MNPSFSSHIQYLYKSCSLWHEKGCTNAKQIIHDRVIWISGSKAHKKWCYNQGPHKKNCLTTFHKTSRFLNKLKGSTWLNFIASLCVMRAVCHCFNRTIKVVPSEMMTYDMTIHCKTKNITGHHSIFTKNKRFILNMNLLWSVAYMYVSPAPHKCW